MKQIGFWMQEVQAILSSDYEGFETLKSLSGARSIASIYNDKDLFHMDANQTHTFYIYIVRCVRANGNSMNYCSHGPWRIRI